MKIGKKQKIYKVLKEHSSGLSPKEIEIMYLRTFGDGLINAEVYIYLYRLEENGLAIKKEDGKWIPTNPIIAKLKEHIVENDLGQLLVSKDFREAIITLITEDKKLLLFVPEATQILNGMKRLNEEPTYFR